MKRDARGRFIPKGRQRDANGRFIGSGKRGRSSVRLNDGVLAELVGRFAPSDDPHTKVGVLADKGGSAVREGGVSMVEIALIHEFGNEDIPERSFIRRTFREKEAETRKVMAQLAGQVVQGALTLEKALDILGAWAAGEVKKTIAMGEPIPPPLAPSTIKRKKSSRPLVDKGQLVGTIAHEVAT